MPREALSCVRCDRPLTNEFDEMTNQPSGGTAFESEGHYGSTAFDPMDGSFIEVNLCDECLVLLRDKGAVLYSRKRKMVLCEGTIVGWTKAIRPYTPWTGDEPSDNEARPGEERLVVEPEEVGDHDLYPEIEWLASGLMVARGLAAEAHAEETVPLGYIDRRCCQREGCPSKGLTWGVHACEVLGHEIATERYIFQGIADENPGDSEDGGDEVRGQS